MGNQTRIIKLFEAAKKREGGRFNTALLVVAGVVIIVLLVTTIVLMVMRGNAIDESNTLKQQVTYLEAKSEALSEKVQGLQSDLRAEKDRNQRVALLANEMRVYNLRLKGNELTGLVKNSGDNKIGDIELKAIVEEPDGTVYSQIQVFPSLDGWPLTRGQVRTFRFVLDREPGEGAKASVLIVDLEKE